MILNRLQLSNYKQYGRLELEFREGLVGITGKNGAGKSTIFEAVLYCLFGKDENNKSLLRSSFADPKATVSLQLDFTIGEAMFSVLREFRGKALSPYAELRRNDQLIANGAAAVNEQLIKFLKVERDSFKKSVFSGQRELAELSDAKSEERKKLVRKMLGLETLDGIQTDISADFNNLKNRMIGQRQNLLSDEEIQVLQAQIESFQEKKGASEVQQIQASEKLQQLDNQYKIAKANFESEEKKQQEHHAVSTRIASLRSAVETLQKQQIELTEKISLLHNKEQELSLLRSELQDFPVEQEKLKHLEEVSRQRARQQELLEKTAELNRQLAARQEEIDSLEQALDTYSDLEEEFGQAQRQASAVQVNIETCRLEQQQIQNRMADLSGRIRDRENQIRALKNAGRTGDCPTCHQPLLDAYENVLQQLLDEINSLQGVELGALEQQKKELESVLNSLHTQQRSLVSEQEMLRQKNIQLAGLLAQWKSLQQQSGDLQQRLDVEQAQLAQFQDIELDEKAFQALKSRVVEREPRYRKMLQDTHYVQQQLPETLAALENTLQRIVDHERSLQEAVGVMASIQFDPTKYEAAKNTLTSYDVEVRQQSTLVHNLELQIQQFKHDTALNQGKLQENERIQQQLAEKSKESDILERLSKLLGSFKTEVLERVSPSISREASQLFNRITKGKYENIRVDDNFEFSIAADGNYYPIERFSGGEIDLANFCLRIAITKAIMELSGSGNFIEFLAFDEIFGSQDEERRHEIMLALHFLQEQFRQIYIISHIDSVKDYFPNILEVRYSPAGSDVRWL